MLPCLVMLGAAIAVAVATGQPARVLGGVACMAMMMVMMSAMGGHKHRDNHEDGHTADSRWDRAER
jgi:hypothetical protein